MFSVIMPCYNASAYLYEAIESVIKQSYHDWELLIVDDKSEDDSMNIVRNLSKDDQRIKLFGLTTHSGNPRKPREYAMKYATGDFFVFLDADDSIEIDYLKKFVECIEETNASVALPIMQNYDEMEKKIIGSLPSQNSVLKNIPMSGPDACLLTIPNYRIGCGGMAFHRNLYAFVREENSLLSDEIISDEIAERIILFHASIVVQTDAIYKYIQRAQSITHRKTEPKYYSLLLGNIHLLDFVKNNYDESVKKQCVKKIAANMISLYKVYIQNKSKYSYKECKHISHIFATAYNVVHSEYSILSPTYKIWYFNFVSFKLICIILNFIKRRKE